MNKKEKDRCVLCKEKTQYNKDVPVNARKCYVEGVGQLCPLCFASVYKR